MGVDVVFKARTTPRLDREAFDELRLDFHTEYPDPNQETWRDYRFPDLKWDPYEDQPTIEVDCLERYYGPGYERGHWPDIRRRGDWLMRALPPGAEIRYGGDSDDDWAQLRPWPEVAAECDRLWATVENEPYLAHIRRR